MFKCEANFDKIVSNLLGYKYRNIRNSDGDLVNNIN